VRRSEARGLHGAGQDTSSDYCVILMELYFVVYNFDYQMF
jgi:hypothetical protein